MCGLSFSCFETDYQSAKTDLRYLIVRLRSIKSNQLSPKDEKNCRKKYQRILNKCKSLPPSTDKNNLEKKIKHFEDNFGHYNFIKIVKSREYKMNDDEKHSGEEEQKVVKLDGFQKNRKDSQREQIISDQDTNFPPEESSVEASCSGLTSNGQNMPKTHPPTKTKESNQMDYQTKKLERYGPYKKGAKGSYRSYNENNTSIGSSMNPRKEPVTVQNLPNQKSFQHPHLPALNQAQSVPIAGHYLQEYREDRTQSRSLTSDTRVYIDEQIRKGTNAYKEPMNHSNFAYEHGEKERKPNNSNFATDHNFGKDMRNLDIVRPHNVPRENYGNQSSSHYNASIPSENRIRKDKEAWSNQQYMNLTTNSVGNFFGTQNMTEMPPQPLTSEYNVHNGDHNEEAILNEPMDHSGISMPEQDDENIATQDIYSTNSTRATDASSTINEDTLPIIVDYDTSTNVYSQAQFEKTKNENQVNISPPEVAVDVKEEPLQILDVQHFGDSSEKSNFLSNQDELGKSIETKSDSEGHVSKSAGNLRSPTQFEETNLKQELSIKSENQEHISPPEEAVEVKEEPLQILDVHQYFRDFDLNSLDELQSTEQIQKIKTIAGDCEESVNNFTEEKYSLQYFVLDEKLMRLIEKLDKIKDDQVIKEKVEVIEYIKRLHATLDKNAKEE